MSTQAGRSGRAIFKTRLPLQHFTTTSYVSQPQIRQKFLTSSHWNDFKADAATLPHRPLRSVRSFLSTMPAKMLRKHAFRWGHLRPAIALSANLLLLADDLVVTLLIPHVLSETAANELKRYPVDKSRLHILNSSSSRAPKSTGLMGLHEMSEDMGHVVGSITEVWPKLVNVGPGFL